MRVSDDLDILTEAASEALNRPDSYMNFDCEVQYGTHGAVMTWADRGDNLLAKSNFRVMLRELEAVAPDSDDVLDRSASHWMFGSLRTIFVRVYLDGWDAGRVARVAKRAPHDAVRLYTPAFRLAVALASGLTDYPILDKSDFSELESEAWHSVLYDAIDAARMEYDDTVAEDVMFYELLVSGYRSVTDSNCVQYRDLRDLFGRGECSPDMIDWDCVSAEYARIRNEHFEWLAARQWQAIQEERHRNDVPLF